MLRTAVRGRVKPPLPIGVPHRRVDFRPVVVGVRQKPGSGRKIHKVQLGRCRRVQDAVQLESTPCMAAEQVEQAAFPDAQPTRVHVPQTNEASLVTPNRCRCVAVDQMIQVSQRHGRCPVEEWDQQLTETLWREERCQPLQPVHFLVVQIVRVCGIRRVREGTSALHRHTRC